MNRSDVRLGMDFFGMEDDGVRVLNGVRRGEVMDPILIRQFGEPPEDLAGFERVPPEQISLAMRLTQRQREYWQKLPRDFTFEQAENLMGKANFSRLSGRALSHGILERITVGVYRKLVD